MHTEVKGRTASFMSVFMSIEHQPKHRISFDSQTYNNWSYYLVFV